MKINIKTLLKIDCSHSKFLLGYGACLTYFYTFSTRTAFYSVPRHLLFNKEMTCSHLAYDSQRNEGNWMSLIGVFI
jgi:hypothetical protein